GAGSRPRLAWSNTAQTHWQVLHARTGPLRCNRHNLSRAATGKGSLSISTENSRARREPSQLEVARFNHFLQKRSLEHAREGKKSGDHWRICPLSQKLKQHP